jgi:hypothetical protein
VHDRALEQLLAPAQHEDEPRPKLESHGDYVFGVLLVPSFLVDEDELFYQEVDLVMTRDALVKSTASRTTFDDWPSERIRMRLSSLRHDVLRAGARPGRGRPRLPPGEDRERAERRNEEADRDRVDPAPPHLDRRHLRL